MLLKKYAASFITAGKKEVAVKAEVMTSAVLIVLCRSSRQPSEIKKIIA
ncbi:MAG TPA: hypothetical protein VLS94_05640 [Fusibacter sp.]|nr:hypothetical protein [Fusibacter sp.]